MNHQKMSRVFNVYSSVITDALTDAGRWATEWRETEVLEPTDVGLVSKTVMVATKWEMPILQIRVRTSRILLTRPKTHEILVPSHRNNPAQTFLALLPVWADGGPESRHLKGVMDENGSTLAVEPA